MTEKDKKENTESATVIKLEIADIIIEARCNIPGVELQMSPSRQDFIVEDGQPDCVLNVHYGPLPDINLEQQLFDSGDGPWSLHTSGEKLVFRMHGSNRGESYVHRIAVFEPEFDRADLYVRSRSELPNAAASPQEEVLYFDPFSPPLDEWLIVNLLARGRGIHAHSLGILHDGQALVFCGVSGAGKSTLAELWKKRQVAILSDDRIAIRKREGKVWAYGTPWHGDARVSLAEKAPLNVIYFIVQGPENRVLPMSATDIATRLIVRCFPTFYLPAGMDYTLKFITELAEEVPCFELQFTPDEGAIDTVLQHVERQTK